MNRFSFVHAQSAFKPTVSRLHVQAPLCVFGFGARSITDAFMHYVMKNKADYRLFTTACTPDFSPDSEAEAAVLRNILARKRHKVSVLLGLNDADVAHSAAEDTLRSLSLNANAVSSTEARTAPLLAAGR